MTVDRRMIADALFTAAVMGIGFATGVPTVAAIVGGNLAIQPGVRGVGPVGPAGE